MVLVFSWAWAADGLAEEKYYKAPVLWQASIGYGQQSSPAMDSKGMIYVTTRIGGLCAVSPDGQLQWRYRIHADTISTPAVGADGTIFFGARDRMLHAVTPEGKRKWTFTTGHWIEASPALAEDGTVYIGSWDKNFYAISSEGREKWRFKTDGPIASSAAVGATGQVLFGSNDGKLYCLDANGAKQWEFKTRGAIIASPTIGTNGTIYFPSVDGKLYTLDAAGKKQWALQIGSTTGSSPILDGQGNLYLCNNSNYLAISASGQQIWERFIWDQPQWPPDGSGLALANGQLVFSSSDGRVMALTPDSDWVWLHWMFGPSVSSPLVGPTGIIYATGLSCGLEALEGKVPAANSPWPMFRANPQRTGRVKPTL